LYEAAKSSWYAFRWRRLLKLFETRYNIQAKVILDEAGNYAAYDLDLFDQLTYYSQQCLADPRILALTFYLWEDPTFSPGNIFNDWSQFILDLPGFVQRLAAWPDVRPDPFMGERGVVSVAGDLYDGPAIRVSFEDGHIESLALEQYLRAVVPAEMPALWPSEALKAQAVAARTFAVKSLQRARSQGKAADITSTFARSQQFDRSRVHPASDEAILATRGEVLVYDGDIIEALYSANCGGHTFDNEAVGSFTRTPIPYLRGVACPNPGPKYGHGVGLCQYGTKALAEQGRSYQQILAHYYQGAQLNRMPYNR